MLFIILGRNPVKYVPTPRTPCPSYAFSKVEEAYGPVCSEHTYMRQRCLGGSRKYNFLLSHNELMTSEVKLIRYLKWCHVDAVRCGVQYEWLRPSNCLSIDWKSLTKYDNPRISVRNWDSCCPNRTNWHCHLPLERTELLIGDFHTRCLVHNLFVRNLMGLTPASLEPSTKHNWLGGIELFREFRAFCLAVIWTLPLESVRELWVDLFVSSKDN